MKSVLQDVGEASGTAQEGLKDVLTVDTTKVRPYLHEVVRSTPIEHAGARWRATDAHSSDLQRVSALASNENLRYSARNDYRDGRG